MAHPAFSAVVSTNNTNQVRMHIPSYLTNYHSPKSDSFNERAKDEWEQKMDRLSADYLHHFDINMRWLRYENYNDFEKSVNRKGKALIRKPIEYGLREAVAEAPIIYSLGEKNDFLRRLIKNSVGNTSEEEIMPTEITYTTNTITIGADTNKVSFWKTLSSNLREAKQYPGVRPLILAFHLFTNAVNPILLFSAIYLEKTFGASDPFKVKTFLSVIAAYTLGAVIGGALSDKIGHRRMVLASLALTAVATIPLASVQQLAPTIIFFPIYGLGIGMVYASSRAYLASLIPSTESGRFFGLYTFAEKLGQVIGPITWTFIVLMFAGYAPGNYRIATFATGMFVLASMITIARKEKTPHHKAE